MKQYVKVLAFLAILLNSQLIIAQFAAPQLILDSQIRYPRMQLVDLDQDGNLDILFFTILEGHIAWIKNLGDGLLGKPFKLTSPDIQNIAHVAVGDLNGDDRLDIIFAADSWLYRMDQLPQMGTFGSPVLINTNATSRSESRLLVPLI